MGAWLEKMFAMRLLRQAEQESPLPLLIVLSIPLPKSGPWAAQLGLSWRRSMTLFQTKFPLWSQRNCHRRQSPAEPGSLLSVSTHRFPHAAQMTWQLRTFPESLLRCLVNQQKHKTVSSSLQATGNICPELRRGRLQAFLGVSGDLRDPPVCPPSSQPDLLTRSCPGCRQCTD